jgi:hypothetical protein
VPGGEHRRQGAPQGSSRRLHPPSINPLSPSSGHTPKAFVRRRPMRPRTRPGM